MQGALPHGTKSICIGADGKGGCGVEQEEIYWQLDEKDQLHFVTQPHGCPHNCCFRPCLPDGEGSWKLDKAVRTTSAVTANKMIERRRAAGL